MRSGRIIAPLDRALVSVTALPFQEELEPFAPAQPTYWTFVSCHFFLWHQTLRRLGGRQPLWGIGVTSLIEITVSPAACNARTADSRPPPGPLTCTTTLRIPTSAAFLAAASAAICAANGVPLRDPLKPTEPALDHEITRPCWSVSVTIVLLQVS